MSILAMFLGELLRRACLLGEDVLAERHDGKILFKLLAKVSCDDLACLAVSIILAFVAHYNHNAEAGAHFLLLFVNIAFILPIIDYFANIRKPVVVDKSGTNETERYNKNLADGLAWSYYFGYLKLILPKLDEEVGRARVRDKLDPVKFFILIPKSCYCPDTIDDKYMKVHTNLRVLSTNRGGVHNRTYDQTVYKITIPENVPENEKYSGTYYCLAQYATPLLTLYDMSEYKIAPLSVEERLTQVTFFYNRLKEILDQDEKCRGKYELLLLPDNSDVALKIVRQIKNAPVEISD